MSLIKQLWLAIVLVAMVAFSGSLLVSSLSARAYLQEQLLLKNVDTAASLASTLSQMPKDEVTIELLVASQFDTGHYESIRLVDPRGKVIVERRSDVHIDGAPGWFMRMVPLHVTPGIAQVQDGWKQYGTLTLSSHARFAYRELWTSTLRLLAWFIAAAVLTGIAGTVILRLILRPLDGIVRQAEAIGARRFITAGVPRTPEFAAVVRAMNALAKRVRQMLEDESQRLEQLRREAHHDAVTGLLNRGHFMARLLTALGREDESARGVLVIARLLDLNELNRNHGWPVVDALIRRFARTLESIGPAEAEWMPGRLNGSDFALLAPGCDDAAGLARRVQESMAMIAREFGLANECHLPAAATLYRHGDQLGRILARVDAALTIALEPSGGSVQVAAPDQRFDEREPRDGLDVWRERFIHALNPNQIKLHSYPVVDAAGRFLHNECVARMRLDRTSDWLHAGDFVPWLARLGNLHRLDEMVVDLALERLQHGADDICINLSAQAMNDAVLVHRIASKLGRVRENAVRLWIEIPEHGVFQHLEHFRVLCALLKPLGCHLGIEHVGHQVSRIGQLHDIGIDYIKIDAAFVKGIDENQANQVFLRGLAMIAHSIGLSTLAEGVDSAAELRTLVELGFDGATGPAVTLMLDNEAVSG